MPALPAGHQSLHDGVRDPARSADRGDARRCGHDVSGLQRKAEDTAAGKVGRSHHARTGRRHVASRLVAADVAVALFVLARPRDAHRGAAGVGRQLQFLPVRGNIYVLQGAGANITVSIGRDGVLMVDSGLASMGDQVLAAIRRLQNQLDLRDKPVVVGSGDAIERRRTGTSRARPSRSATSSTHTSHPDHVGANELLRRVRDDVHRRQRRRQHRRCRRGCGHHGARGRPARG